MRHASIIKCTVAVAVAYMIYSLEEFCFFSTMGIVPGEQGELSNRGLQVGSAQGKALDT